MCHLKDALLYTNLTRSFQGQIKDDGEFYIGTKPRYTWRVEESKEEEKTVAQEVIEAREFVKETTRNAWVPEDMKRCLEKHITRLCNIIEYKEHLLQEMTDKQLSLRGECQRQSDMLDCILNLNLDFERINPVPTMSKLTKQCVDAYNTCVAIKSRIEKYTKGKVHKAIEKAKEKK